MRLVPALAVCLLACSAPSDDRVEDAGGTEADGAIPDAAPARSPGPERTESNMSSIGVTPATAPFGIRPRRYDRAPITWPSK